MNLNLPRSFHEHHNFTTFSTMINLITSHLIQTFDTTTIVGIEELMVVVPLDHKVDETFSSLVIKNNLSYNSIKKIVLVPSMQFLYKLYKSISIQEPLAFSFDFLILLDSDTIFLSHNSLSLFKKFKNRIISVDLLILAGFEWYVDVNFINSRQLVNISKSSIFNQVSEPSQVAEPNTVIKHIKKQLTIDPRIYSILFIYDKSFNFDNFANTCLSCNFVPIIYNGNNQYKVKLSTSVLCRLNFPCSSDNKQEDVCSPQSNNAEDISFDAEEVVLYPAPYKKYVAQAENLIVDAEVDEMYNNFKSTINDDALQKVLAFNHKIDYETSITFDTLKKSDCVKVFIIEQQQFINTQLLFFESNIVDYVLTAGSNLNYYFDSIKNYKL